MDHFEQFLTSQQFFDEQILIEQKKIVKMIILVKIFSCENMIFGVTLVFDEN